MFKNIWLIACFIPHLMGCKAQEMIRKSQFTKTEEGFPLHFRQFGAGKPIIIINGGPGMNANGFEIVAKSIKGYKTILYDQRGTGFSTLPTLDSTTLNMEKMVNDLEAIRKHLNIDTWTVMGHSFGGLVACLYATKHPKRIEKMILSASGGIDLELTTYFQGELNQKLTILEQDSLAFWSRRINIEGDTSYHARLRRGYALAPAYLYDKKFVPQLAHRLTQGNARVNQLIWEDLTRIKYDCSNSLKTFLPKVLIIQGENDLILPKTAEKARRVLPNSRVVLIEKCGHYGWLDNPTVYFDAIHNFLKE